MSLSMTRAEREAFLAEPWVGVIAIDQPEAPPLSVPIWYDYRPEVGVWLITGATSQKGRCLAAAGRFSLVAQDPQPPGYRYVSVEGPIIETREADIEKDLRPMARRYFGLEGGDAYTDNVPHDAPTFFVMEPQRWRTVDYRKMGAL